MITPAAGPQPSFWRDEAAAVEVAGLHQRRPALAWPTVGGLTLAVVALHGLVNLVSPYGFHRDEFLYLAMGRHLRLWAMDFPPFIAIVAEVSRAVFGDSRAAIRLGPALAAGALVLLAAALARELGGRRGAQLLAAGAVAASPLFLRTGALFQPVVFDQLWWTLALFALVRLARHAAIAATLDAPRADPTPTPRVAERRDGPRRGSAFRAARPARAGELAFEADGPPAPPPAMDGATTGSDLRVEGVARGALVPRPAGPVLEIAEAPTLDLGAPPAPQQRPRHRLRVHVRRAMVREWLLLGVAGGLGLLTKFSIGFVALPMAVALVATPLRRTLRRPWPWLAVALALVLGSPSVVGQLRLDWPVRGQMADLQASQLARVGPAEFLGGQLLLGPAVVLAALGLWALLAAPTLRWARAAGLTALGAFVLLLALRGKPYYVGPVYPLLFAAGAVALGRAVRGAVPAVVARVPRRIRLGVMAACIGAYGLVTLPLGLPILPPALMARYGAALGIGAATRTNAGTQLALPQDYADMLGWPQLAAATWRAWASLPPERRAEAAIAAENYGQAGAIDYYGPGLGLPAAVSTAGSYWFFGPGPRTGDPLLTVGVPLATLARLCARVVPFPPVRHEYTRWQVPEEVDVPIALCEGLRPTLQELWPQERGRN